jgi:two-component system response regulator DesR
MLLVRGLGLDMIGVARMGSAIRELHAARRELARLAVIEERERLSRDLHDLLEQTLSMITLKSELARQLVTEEPNRCARELSEIEVAARQTLHEVREAVAGYLQPDLRSELEGARQLLEAAGIEGGIDPIQEVLPPAIDAALAWMVREGVTNVIRHSRAGTVEAAQVAQPDVALLDIEMPDGGGLAAAAALRKVLPSCHTVILTTFGRSGYLQRAMESGAVGFLLKDAPAAELALALRRVMAGERVVDPDPALSALSASLFGASLAEIATRLVLSEGTVRNYLSTAMQKLGAKNRVEAARLAEQKGWL